MEKRKVFIAIHQLNLGGAQKALMSALNAIDYSEKFKDGEEVTTSKLIKFAQDEFKINKVDLQK